jgi:hypothetical protein
MRAKSTPNDSDLEDEILEETELNLYYARTSETHAGDFVIEPSGHLLGGLDLHLA